MPSDVAGEGRRVLDPVERASEVLFGLIMVLTFTGSLSVAEAGREEVRKMLIGALGCNLAWGIIDAILYAMGEVAEHRQGVVTLAELRKTADPERGRAIVADAVRTGSRPAGSVVSFPLERLPDMAAISPLPRWMRR